MQYLKTFYLAALCGFALTIQLQADDECNNCETESCCTQESSGSCMELGPCACDRQCNYHSDYYHTTGYWASSCDNDCVHARQMGKLGVWMPEGPPLFRPFIADPRQITYSVGWRWNDQAITKNVIPVSLYDVFPIYRFCSVGPWKGQLDFALWGALWAAFDPISESAPLINADYYGGLHITYAFDCWSFRLRGFHISSHLGDEFLLDHPGFDRRNPSAEFIDFFVSNQFTRELRLYAGAGYIVHEDKSFARKPFYMEAGVELRIIRLGFLSHCYQLYGEPFYAMHWRYTGDFKNHIDLTYALGYEFGKLCGSGHKLRFYLLYHDGYSAEGQFGKIATNYLAVMASYGF